MMQLPARRPLPLDDAIRFTDELLRHWRPSQAGDGEAIPSAHVVDCAARWMLQLRAEIRAARTHSRQPDARRQQLERLLDRLDRGLRPRLRGALHQRLRGLVFSLRLRRPRPRVEIV